jgi:hypothetical protein
LNDFRKRFVFVAYIGGVAAKIADETLDVSYETLDATKKSLENFFVTSNEIFIASNGIFAAPNGTKKKSGARFTAAPGRRTKNRNKILLCNYTFVPTYNNLKNIHKLLCTLIVTGEIAKSGNP